MRSAILVAGLVGWGCAVDGDTAPAAGTREPAFLAEAEAGPSLLLWGHTAELEQLAKSAAQRLYDTSGLVVEVNSDMGRALPVFMSDSGIGYWQGLCASDEYDWIALSPDTPEDRRETVMLHEIMHALGAVHIPESGYLMSPQTGAPLPIRDLDLASLCAVASCVWMQPE